MGGFEYTIVRLKQDTQNICDALDEFSTYLKATFPFDPTGLTNYSRFKNENDVIWLDEQGNPVRRVKDRFPEYLEDLKNGKEILYWLEITWLQKIPSYILTRLRDSLKKHDCEWFWKELFPHGIGTTYSVVTAIENAYNHKKIKTTNFEEYLNQFKNNKIIWEKQDSKTTILTCWKNPLICETEGCGKETHLTSRANSRGGSFHHPLCEDCYKELHAYYVAVVTSEKETLKR